LSQFRFDKIHLIPDTATSEELSSALKEDVGDVKLNRGGTIVDVYVEKAVNKLVVNAKCTKPQLNYF